MCGWRAAHVQTHYASTMLRGTYEGHARGSTLFGSSHVSRALWGNVHEQEESVARTHPLSDAGKQIALVRQLAT